MQHLDPQTPMTGLVGMTTANYAAAISFYQQRKQIFYNFLEQNRMNTLEFETQVNEGIEQAWNKGLLNILKGIYFNPSLTAEQKQVEVEKKFSTSPYLQEMLQAIKQGNPAMFYRSLGFVFEGVGINDVLNPVFDKISNLGSQHAEALVQAFETGAEKSLASIVSGSRNIRPDTIIALRDMKIENTDGVAKINNVPIELQGNLFIDWENAAPTSEEIMEKESLLNSFLQNSNFFGFSMKTWGANTDGKHFMSSSVMQKMLNSVFNTTDSNGNRHPWEYDYVTEYVVYSLSKNIFDIVGPTDIGMFTAAGITWMDDFLAAHVFFMRVQATYSINGGNRTGGKRTFPQILDSSIYIRNYERGRSITSLKAGKKKRAKDGNGNYYNYIDLKLGF